MLIAPAAGTAAYGGAGLDVLIANTGGDRDGIGFGMLAPSGSPVRIEPDSPPTRLIHYTGLEGGGSPVSSLRHTSASLASLRKA